MRKATTALLMVLRLTGLIQIVAGLFIWFGHSRALVPAHSVIGSLFVLDLWILGIVALFELPSRGFALFTLVWGGFVLWLGMAQMSLLPGSSHWIIRVVHLLVGLAAMGFGESLAGRVKRLGNAEPAAPEKA